MSEDYKRVELFRQTDAKRFDNTEKHDMSFMRQAAETGAETKIEANAGIKANASAEAEANANTRMSTGTQIDADIRTNAEAGTNANPKIGSEAGIDTNTKIIAEAETNTNAEPDTDADGYSSAAQQRGASVQSDGGFWTEGSATVRSGGMAGENTEYNSADSAVRSHDGAVLVAAQPAEEYEEYEENTMQDGMSLSAEEVEDGEPDIAPSEESEAYPVREALPDFALMPAENKSAAKLIPADGDLKSSRLRITGVYSQTLPVMMIEEDVLVPDVEPDLAQILNIDAKPEITSHDIYQGQNGNEMYKISGVISVNTLYIPVSDSCELISMNSKINFRRECEADFDNGGKSGSSSAPEISAELLSVKSKVINERKIRIQAEVRCTVKKYIEEETEFLEGVRDGELNLRKETICFTDIAQRRTDTTDVSGEVIFKENMPELDRILNYDVNVVEGRRQVGKGKAVIDACAYYSILYIPKAGAVSEEGETEGCSEDTPIPVFYRGKLEFTQFIKLPDVTGANASDSRVTFDVISSKLGYETPEDGDGKQRLMLSLTVAAGIDIFRGMEREIVTDMYHRVRDVDFSTTSRRVSELCGSGAAEISVREIITLPESEKGFGRIPYISASVERVEAEAENGKCRVEGIIETNTVYEAEEGDVGFASFAQKLPFRTLIDIPGIREGMSVDFSCGMKDIWFDRMNSRQVEFNCTLFVSVYAWKVEEYDFIDKVCYIEREEAAEDGAGMVVYVTRPGDTQWSIAKEFRTTMQELQLINGLGEGDYVEAGKKLLIL